jgi:hypothetical protein
MMAQREPKHVATLYFNPIKTQLTRQSRSELFYLIVLDDEVLRGPSFVIVRVLLCFSAAAITASSLAGVRTVSG